MTKPLLTSLSDTSVNVAIPEAGVSVLVDSLNIDEKTLCSSFSITFDSQVAYVSKSVEVFLYQNELSDATGWNKMISIY